MGKFQTKNNEPNLWLDINGSEKSIISSALAKKWFMMNECYYTRKKNLALCSPSSITSSLM